MLNPTNQHKFHEFRKKFPVFIYDSYSFTSDSTGLIADFHFSLPGQTEFNPTLKIPGRPFFRDKNIPPALLDDIIFHIGLIELVSYWKSACPPEIIVKCGSLGDDQARWWKKLYFKGLGEFFYLNGIETTEADFVTFVTEGSGKFNPSGIPVSDEVVIPVGGGKDSVVTLELLGDLANTTPFILNPRGATLETTSGKGFSQGQIIEAYRTLDPRLLQLNDLGFLNGHTPFSALLAFISVLAAMLSGKKYIALSNEASANESTVEGVDVNHQYSKSYEFESDFRDYVRRYITPDIEYFSFLRPLNELRISSIFARYPAYFPVFKSCNAGSKSDTWCGECSKCLFTWIILSPFISQEELRQIFHKDLLVNPELEHVMDDLTGASGFKPFDCVGTILEVNVALCELIRMMNGRELPFILARYKESSRYGQFRSYPFGKVIEEYNTANFLPGSFAKILQSSLHD